MKKLLAIFLGLGLMLATVTPTFAQNSGKKHKRKGGGGKRKGSGTRNGPSK